MPAVFGTYIDWNGDGDYSDPREDVTKRILDRTNQVIQFGRDQLRTLSPIAPGQAELELNNISRDYSPENSASPLVGSILPGRGLKLQATLNSATTVLFWGYLDDYQVLPDTDTRSVRITALDVLGKFDTSVSVDLNYSITTGQAIGLVLDAIGWPTAARQIDMGATTIRWYWEEGTNGLVALQQLVDSEGPGSLVYVDYSTGNFVFKGRHHRLTDARSTTSQATFRGSGPEPVLSRPLTYDQGWKSIVNSVSFSIEERDPTPELESVFSSDRIYDLANGETLAVFAQADDPFFGALVPVQDTDYILMSGVVQITMSRTAGQSTLLLITAVGGPAQIQGLQVRAYPVRVTRTLRVTAEESSSIDKYGRRGYPNTTPTWVGVNDGLALAELILGQRAQPLAIVKVRLISANDTRLAHQLARKLSDRITIVDTETGLNGEFFIERVEHRVMENGLFLETVFGCEKIPVQPSNVFRFDVAGAGFDDGVFGAIGLDNPANIFLFDSVSHGFNSGVFAH